MARKKKQQGKATLQASGKEKEIARAKKGQRKRNGDPRQHGRQMARKNKGTC